MVKWRVKEIGEAKGFNAYSLALVAGVGYNSVRPMWRNTARRADLDTIDRLSKALGVEPGELIARVPDETQPAEEVHQ